MFLRNFLNVFETRFFVFFFKAKCFKKSVPFKFRGEEQRALYIRLSIIP